MYTQQHITAKGALLLHYDGDLGDSENKLASLINFISLKVMHVLLYMFSINLALFAACGPPRKRLSSLY